MAHKIYNKWGNFWETGGMPPAVNKPYGMATIPPVEKEIDPEKPSTAAATVPPVEEKIEKLFTEDRIWKAVLTREQQVSYCGSGVYGSGGIAVYVIARTFADAIAKLKDAGIIECHSFESISSLDDRILL